MRTRTDFAQVHLAVAVKKIRNNFAWTRKYGNDLSRTAELAIKKVKGRVAMTDRNRDADQTADRSQEHQNGKQKADQQPEQDPNVQQQGVRDGDKNVQDSNSDVLSDTVANQ